MGSNLIIRGVLYVPNFKCNLISIRELIHIAYLNVIFTDKLCILQDRNTRTRIGLGEFRNEVYYIKLLPSQVSSHTTSVDTAMLLHQRLGHSLTHSLNFISSTSSNSQVKKVIHACDTCSCTK